MPSRLPGWEVARDHIQSSAGSSDNDYLILSIHVPGFKWACHSCHSLSRLFLSWLFFFLWLPPGSRHPFTDMRARSLAGLRLSLRRCAALTVNSTSWWWGGTPDNVDQGRAIFCALLSLSLHLSLSVYLYLYMYVSIHKSLHKFFFFLFQDVNRKSTTVVESWENSKTRQSFTHVMTKNASVSYTWAFQRTNQPTDVSLVQCWCAESLSKAHFSSPVPCLPQNHPALFPWGFCWQSSWQCGLIVGPLHWYINYVHTPSVIHMNVHSNKHLHMRVHSQKHMAHICASIHANLMYTCVA